jgi:hypothetical protein
MTKAKAWKGVGWKCNSKATFAFLRVREWRNEPTHFQMDSHFGHLGIGIPLESKIFKEGFQKSKFIGLRKSLYHWKFLEM